ncbi:MAG: transporter, partial [Bacteroidota bacterium]
MRVNCYIIVCFWGLIFLAQSGWGQACCSGGVPISSTLGLSTKNQGDLQIQVSYDLNTLQNWFTGSEAWEEITATRRTHSFLLEGNYDISPAWSVNAVFTYIRQTRLILRSDDFVANQGPGDAILLLRYNILHRKPESRWGWVLGLGPKFPLGRNDFTDSRGITLAADLQPGTGAWDGVAWTQISHQLKSVPNLSLSLNGLFRLTGSALRFGGLQEYRFGNEFQGQLGLSYRMVLGSLLLDPLLTLRYRHVAADQSDGSIQENTGGRWGYLRPGLNINISPET